MAQRTCTIDGCEKPHRARGLCSSHYNAEHQPNRHPVENVRCAQCGAVVSKRRDARFSHRFCSLTCRDLWRIETDNNPAPPPVERTVSKLPTNHPVRVLIRERARLALRGPLRVAYESGDWTSLLRTIEAECVKVDGCWLWSRRAQKGYGVVHLIDRDWFVHRLTAHASRAGSLDARMPVHHTCSERLCCNPLHLQVVTPHENTAEMLERRYYIDRIAELESALRDIDPNHPLVASRIAPAA